MLRATHLPKFPLISGLGGIMILMLAFVTYEPGSFDSSGSEVFGIVLLALFTLGLIVLERTTLDIANGKATLRKRSLLRKTETSMPINVFDQVVFNQASLSSRSQIVLHRTFGEPFVVFDYRYIFRSSYQPSERALERAARDIASFIGVPCTIRYLRTIGDEEGRTVTFQPEPRS